MDQPLYDIYFTGQLVEGIDTSTAKANLASLFKTTAENVAKIFNGKPQALKRGVNKAEALKYKAALHKAGLLVAVKAHQAAAANSQPKPSPIPAAATPTPTPTATPIPTPAAKTEDEDWTLAPAGSDVLKENERKTVAERDIDTSNIKMVSAFMDIEPEAKITPPAPNTAHISVALAGEDLLVDKPQPPPPLPLNLDGITLAPPGTELEELHDDLPPLNPDISGISIAEVGADILENEPKQAPPPPNTDHISVAND